MISAADLHDLGARIRAARRERGLTQQQVADAVGVSRALVLALEYGQAPECAYRTVLGVLNCVGLDLRPTTFNDGSPTLDDLQAEQEAEERGMRPR